MPGMNRNNDGRLFVVANRLPVTITQTEDGQFQYTMAAGGLVSALQGLSKSMEFQWFGWPGTEIHRNDRETVRQELATRFKAVPIFLPKETAERHYNGFSNSVLWPLLHSMPSKAEFNEGWAIAYREVNEMFADNIVPFVEDGDIIWIHDYHLLLLPAVLRKRLANRRSVRIGFFLHTPFPSDDSFAVLPLREDICDGLLSCNLVGLHVREYVEKLLDSAAKVLPGVRRSPSDLHYNDRKLDVQEFPIGIAPDDFRDSLASEATQSEMRHLSREFHGKQIILGVDRLDYIKGIPQKLRAYEKLLTDHPEMREKVVLIQVAIPTRTDVEEYKMLRKQVEGMIGMINGKHGTFTYTPIRYLYRSLNLEQLHALYAVSDVCLVSSIKDGLNMVCYEYIASQQVNRRGVLVLSQYAGAATLLPSAVLFNPYDIPRFTDAIFTALKMPQEDRQSRLDAAVKTVNTLTRQVFSFYSARVSSSSR
ncbi:Alpha-alpha-trehalose-phosphate synthase (UDP-forming) [Penicillium riverlandense]|uniref:Alpha-alpha-trehalose-phosphate synthase (UDP-forming) n=1 Tax=Penicillium riverlandense TaxID=1903569 RepID=UPI002546CD9F|nr:Alpha-alpha-trehalose-phosphate synthase (UDP-forming) [Penicillium riverlandense]KAJ5807769.1 Alpha-alpha-trehalose-phosphate synthase (UDP-forming) [Penicillium riverlandense]